MFIIISSTISISFVAWLCCFYLNSRVSPVVCSSSPSCWGKGRGERAAVWCLVVSCQVKPRQLPEPRDGRTIPCTAGDCSALPGRRGSWGHGAGSCPCSTASFQWPAASPKPATKRLPSKGTLDYDGCQCWAVPTEPGCSRHRMLPTDPSSRRPRALSPVPDPLQVQLMSSADQHLTTSWSSEQAQTHAPPGAKTSWSGGSTCVPAPGREQPQTTSGVKRGPPCWPSAANHSTGSALVLFFAVKRKACSGWIRNPKH